MGYRTRDNSPIENVKLQGVGIERLDHDQNGDYRRIADVEGARGWPFDRNPGFCGSPRRSSLNLKGGLRTAGCVVRRSNDML
ncbi:hypothetical protein HZH68_004724 [Vespula germanica]|uniref:Uncharacterized protein n=1 Tax=Vespula germanica TaxID=30212 RepID=A0A834NK11_VESGE|nr:hypothetical protein HZH68_004724 [Vespula germanica]